MTHGIFSETLLAPDVATEIALTYASHPSLDPIADRRLVELASTVRVQRHRCLVAIERDGLTQPLTSYDRALAALEERLERSVRERERERVRDWRSRPTVNLADYQRNNEDTER